MLSPSVPSPWQAPAPGLPSGRCPSGFASERVIDRPPASPFAVNAPAGTAILGDWRQTRLFIREDVKLDADRPGERFTRNEVVLRVECGLLPQGRQRCPAPRRSTFPRTPRLDSARRAGHPPWSYSAGLGLLGHVLAEQEEAPSPERVHRVRR